MFETEVRVLVHKKAGVDEYDTEFLAVGKDIDQINGETVIRCPECNMIMRESYIRDRAINRTKGWIEEENMDVDKNDLAVTYDPKFQCDHDGGKEIRLDL